MKINKIKLKNFGKVVNMEIELDDHVTRLVWLNGAGKTTIGLTSLWLALKG